MDRFKKSAGSDGLRFQRVTDPIESYSGIICQGVRMRPVPKPPIERHDKLRVSVLKSADLNKTETGQKLTCSRLLNSERAVPQSQLQLMRPRAPPAGCSLSGPDASSVSLPLLEKFRPSRPLKHPKSTRSVICQGLTLPRLPMKRDEKLRDPVLKIVDLNKTMQKPTLSNIVNRGRPVLKAQFEPLRTPVLSTGPSLSGLDASRVWLPPLEKFQPSRPLEPCPYNASSRRTLSTKHTGQDLGLYVSNTPGFPRPPKRN